MPRHPRPLASRAAATRARALGQLAATALALLAAPITPVAARAQSPAADAYVRRGLDAAFSQRQQAVAVAQAATTRREALSRALPSVDLSSTRTEVGGNVVDIGRFINPAYATLNQLIGQPRFPTDLSFRLPFRQQSFVRVTQPVFAPGAWYGAAAAGQGEQVARLGQSAASAQLALDIRLAWLGWHRATQAVAVYDATLPVVSEQLRVTERLVERGLRTPDAVLRARAELSAVRQEREAMAQQADAAGRYLHHLTASPLDQPVTGGTVEEPTPPPALDALLAAARGRAELRQLDAAGRAADAQRRAAQASFLPTLAVALDYGIQGQDYTWNGDREFRMATIVASWNVFSGDADRARVERATLERRAVDARRAEAASLVELQVRTAHRAAVVAHDAVATAREQQAAADRAYQLVRRRYDEGLAPPVELFDARRAATSAALNLVITIADFHARRVELDRAVSASDAPTSRTQP